MQIPVSQIGLTAENHRAAAPGKGRRPLDKSLAEGLRRRGDQQQIGVLRKRIRKNVNGNAHLSSQGGQAAQILHTGIVVGAVYGHPLHNLRNAEA